MRAVGFEELASDAQRVEAGEHLFVLQYSLLHERLEDGAETHFVRCSQRELRDGQAVGVEVEVAGLGPDAAEARSIYGLLVAGGAMPVHLQDIVREQRCAWGRAQRSRPLGEAGPQPGERRGG